MNYKKHLFKIIMALLLPMNAYAASLPGMQGADHIGITVPNMKDAVNFFVNVIGCESSFDLGTLKFEDDWMQVHLNVNPRAEVKHFQMVRCGHGSNLEVFEYTSPGQSKLLPKNSDVGGHHIAFYVDDMSKAVAYFKANGVKMLGEPGTVNDGPAAGMQWVYFLAPWGMQLELVSYPQGRAYEKTTKHLLWDPRNPAK